MDILIGVFESVPDEDLGGEKLDLVNLFLLYGGSPRYEHRVFILSLSGDSDAS